MEKQKLNNYLLSGQTPVGSRLDESSGQADFKSALKDVLHSFPYFQLAQIMFAKKMYDDNEPDVTNRIKLASVYAPDRKSMYILFKRQDFKQDEVITETPVSTTLNDQKEIPLLIEKKEPAKPVETPKPVAKPAPVVVQLPNPPIKEEQKIVPAVATSKQVQPKQVDTRKPYTPPTIIKKRSLYTTPPVKKPEPLVSKPPIPTPPVQPEKIVEEKKIEPIVVQPAIEAPIIETPKVETPLIVPPVVEVPKVETLIIEATVAQTPVIETPSVEKTPPALTEPLIDSTLKYSFSSWLKVLPEIGVQKKHEPMPLSSKETRQMIDKFLHDAPKISRPKAEFFSPVKAAKMSITEDESIVSETLAKIYFSQGNYHKALKAYQTLLEQNPEKNTIFAARIEEIKEFLK